MASDRPNGQTKSAVKSQRVDRSDVDSARLHRAITGLCQTKTGLWTRERKNSSNKSSGPNDTESGDDMPDIIYYI